ncbi:MAG: protein tyrosine phosphatase [Serratia liquefaciens]|nr:protein tyrosine phosphatase [Serratia liquefaciens]
MFDSILVVCVGNICRSPTGERLLKQHLPDKKIASAGLGALVGHAADASAIAVAQQNGLSLEHHSGTQLTKELCREYSLILVMERKHIDGVCRLAPEVRGKTMLFAHWLGQKDIPDPYGKSVEAFDFVYRQLHESAEKWATVLNK